MTEIIRNTDIVIVNTPDAESVSVTTAGNVSVSVNTGIISNAEYKGAYEITPSKQLQVLNTNGLVMRDSITVMPIPNNYGLISYNGSVLTVS